jgi:hypothetical protein
MLKISFLALKKTIDLEFVVPRPTIILLEVYLLKPGTPYSFGGLPPKARNPLLFWRYPKARQPLILLEVLLKPGSP